MARPYNASPWIKTVIRLSASLKLRCLCATVCEPTVDVVLGKVLVILKNNNVARVPMANTVKLPFFYPRPSVVRACLGNGTGTFYWRLLYLPTPNSRSKHQHISDNHQLLNYKLYVRCSFCSYKHANSDYNVSISR